MAGEATILYDIDMGHWPPKTYLVALSPPIRRFDPMTGDPILYPHIALCVKESDPKEAIVYPSDAEGMFVNSDMTAVGRYDYGLPHSVLSGMGYTPTN